MTGASEGYTVAGLLRAGCEASPDRACMRFGDESITYAEMWRRAVAVANGLHDRGVAAGDTVAIQCENCPEFLYTYFGASLVGALTAPVNYHHRGQFLQRQLDLVRARVAVISPDRVDRVAAVAGDVPSLTDVFVVGDDEVSADVPGVSTRPTSDLLGGDGDRLRVPNEPAWSDPNLVLFTSGTTGPSKASVVSNNYIVAASVACVQRKGATADDVFWSPLPLFHGNALMQTVLGPMAAGATGALDVRFSVSGFWDRTRQVGASQVSILGAQFTMLWNRPRRDDDRDNPVRVVYGAPLPSEIHEAFQERFGVVYVTGYGLGEAHPLLVSSVDDPPPPGCAGRAWERFEVRVVDDDDREVPDGEVGEIVCRPREPHVMFDGYLGDPEGTVRSFRNLWFHTGDFGRRRADGWFEFVDRKKDYMRRRGENVSSWEVEQAVLVHPKVAEAAAFPVPSELTEDEIMLVVTLESGQALSPEELIDHCAANMPYFAVPRYVELSRTTLANDLGKVPKHELKARGVTYATWDREAAGYEVRR